MPQAQRDTGREGGRSHPWRRRFDLAANRVSKAAASPWAFTTAALLVGGWLLLGPLAGFSDHWQLFINTFTTIMTFLMVFLLHHAQSKDTVALQLKLDELVAATRGASNRLIDVEDLTEEELESLQARFRELSEGRADAEATSVEQAP